MMMMMMMMTTTVATMADRYNRNWRYHKELRLWLTKESGTAQSQKVPNGEQGTYTFWDPEGWGKERKEMTVLYGDLEETSQPTFAPGVGLQLNTPAMQQAQQVQQQVQQVQQQVQQQAAAVAAAVQRGGFQGVGMAAM